MCGFLFYKICIHNQIYMEIVKGWGFYHSKKHDPLDIIKTTAVIYKTTKTTLFLGRKSVYKAKVHAVNKDGDVYKSLDLGNKQNSTKEFASLEEISGNVRGFIEKMFKDAVKLECCQVTSKNILEEDADQVFKYDAPEYTPDYSINHEEEAEEMVGKILNEEMQKLKATGQLTPDNVEKLVEKLRARGIEAQLNVIKVPKLKMQEGVVPSDPVIPIVDTAVDKIETVQKALSDEEEYKALCKKFGKKNIDKLKHELESKNKKKKSI